MLGINVEARPTMGTNSQAASTRIIDASVHLDPPAHVADGRHLRGPQGDVPELKRKPSEYVKDHIWFTTQPLDYPEDKIELTNVLERMEADKILLFSSDYPHWTFDDPRWLMKHLPERMRDAVMHENGSTRSPTTARTRAVRCAPAGFTAAASSPRTRQAVRPSSATASTSTAPGTSGASSWPPAPRRSSRNGASAPTRSRSKTARSSSRRNRQYIPSRSGGS